MVWFGLVWFGLVWFGLVWFGGWVGGCVGWFGKPKDRGHFLLVSPPYHLRYLVEVWELTFTMCLDEQVNFETEARPRKLREAPMACKKRLLSPTRTIPKLHPLWALFPSWRPPKGVFECTALQLRYALGVFLGVLLLGSVHCWGLQETTCCHNAKTLGRCRLSAL